MTAIYQPFREGLTAGDLLVQRCNSCARPNMYPRHACPHCQSPDLGWEKATGTGTLMSFTVLRAGAPAGFENELPYALAVVRLEEGVQILTRLIPDPDGEWSEYQCDQSVQFVPNVAEAEGKYAFFERAR